MYMNNIPKSFLSPLLAQAKLHFSGNSNGGSTPQSSIIATNHCSNTMTNNSNISMGQVCSSPLQQHEHNHVIKHRKTREQRWQSTGVVALRDANLKVVRYSEE